MGVVEKIINLITKGANKLLIAPTLGPELFGVFAIDLASSAPLA
jgi:hypothetical protein